jgi:predicted CXXCH cytochrome family protein
VLSIVGGSKGATRLVSYVASLTVLLVVLALPAAAFGFAHTDGRDQRGSFYFVCSDCHVTWAGGSDATTTPSIEGAGPHGYYRADSAKCQMCHQVHESAAGSTKLLPAETIQDTCFSCHDNTGAAGVYSAITKRGGSVVASHSIETTTHVPGGSFDLEAKLGCPSCHSVHRATAVAAFRTDRQVPMAIGSAPNGAKYSNQLLRDDVGGKPRGTYTTYGADWCAGCHDRRMSGGTVANHPTEASKTADPGWKAFNYGRIAIVTGANDLTTEILADLDPDYVGTGLGMTNFGYVMPYPRTTGEGGQGEHKPICQQCHEDARNVGSPGAAIPFASETPTNPAFYSFPHQSNVRRFLVEDHDDLCMNCHPTAFLP